MNEPIVLVEYYWKIPFPIRSVFLCEMSYIFDLVNPENPVFVHSEGQFLSYSASSFDLTIVNAIARKPDAISVLTLRTIALGLATVSVRASDSCEGSETQVISVEVTD